MDRDDRQPPIDPDQLLGNSLDLRGWEAILSRKRWAEQEALMGIFPFDSRDAVE